MNNLRTFRIHRAALAALLILPAAALVPQAHADAIQAGLTNSSLTGAPGGTLAFFATLSNPSAIDTIYLNGIGSTAASALLSIDTSPFFNNAPLFLAPGDSSGPFELFDVLIAPGAPTGPYIGSFVTLLGGADGGTGTLFDDLADMNFDVQVSGATVVPEPATIWLTLVILALSLGLARRARDAR
jgi:hypothetical protein